MQRPHPFSFFLGVVSGVLILMLIATGTRMFGGSANTRAFGGGGQNIGRLAQRLGISQDELQKELDSGKTMQQIAQEHGVQLRGGGAGGGRGQQGTSASGSGSSIQSSSPGSSAATSLSSSSSKP